METWQPSREEWQAYPDAIVAQAGGHRVILATNLNLGGSVDVLMPDGVTRLVSNPLGLGFYDPVDGKRVILAELKDCAPQWGAATNEILFRDCFQGVRGSIRYLYTRAGVHQHVVLEQRLQLPEGFSDKSRLECYTELAPNTTWPRVSTRVLRREKDPILRSQMVEPDFTDSELNFGDMAMRGGTAFTLGDTTDGQSIRVGKRFEMISGRPVLTEAVEWRELEPLLARLAAVERPNDRMFAVNPSRQIPQAKKQAQLPRERFRTLGHQKEIQLASHPLSEPAVVIDYELLSSATNMVLRTDTTWLVTGLVNLSGTTRLEGCVVKCTNAASAKINVTGTIDCQTGPYRPAIFTSQYDSTVGESIGTGTPTNYPSGLVISTAGSVLHDLRFAYATNGLILDFTDGQINLTNLQSVNCRYAIDSSANDGNTIIVDNSLFHAAKYGIKGGRDLIVRGQQLTAHNCEKFTYSQSGGDSYAYLTNCLLVGVTNWGSDFTFTTNSTLYYSTDPGGIFQTVGAGAHYLANSITNRGTTNISASLLAALRKKTTYPPTVLSNISISVSTNLVPQAPRDTNNLPELGFHYDPIDFLTSWFTVSNATVTVSDGAVIACYNDTGIWIADGSSIVSSTTKVAALPKAQFIDGSATNLQTEFIFNYVAQIWMPQPAVNFDPVTTNDPAWFVFGYSDTGNGHYGLYYDRLTWAHGFTAQPEFDSSPSHLAIDQTYVDLNADGVPHDATHIDYSPVTAMLRRIDGTQYLWVSRQIKVNSAGTGSSADRSAVEWFRIRTCHR